jgi:hypothetical protein
LPCPVLINCSGQGKKEAGGAVMPPKIVLDEDEVVNSCLVMGLPFVLCLLCLFFYRSYTYTIFKHGKGFVGSRIFGAA